MTKLLILGGVAEPDKNDRFGRIGIGNRFLSKVKTLCFSNGLLQLFKNVPQYGLKAFQTSDTRQLRIDKPGVYA